MTSTVETVNAEGFTLSRLIWKLLGRQPEGYLEQVYEANRGLANLDIELPVGTVVTFPLDDIPATSETIPAVKLWD